MPSTSNDPRKPLTAREACDIIKGCYQSGVGKISFRGLEVTFADLSPRWETRESGRNTGSGAEEAVAIDARTTEKEEFAAKDLQAAEFVITDPSQYEELMADGDFTDESSATRDGDDGDRG